MLKGTAVVSQARAHRGAAGWTSRRNRPLPFPGQTVTESQVVDLEFLEPGIVAAAPAFEADTATGEGDQAGVSKFCDPAKRFAGIKCRGKYPGGLIVGAECDPQVIAVGDLNQHPERLSAGQKLWKTSFETQVDFLNSRDLIGFDVEEIEKTDSLAGNEFQSGLPGVERFFAVKNAHVPPQVPGCVLTRRDEGRLDFKGWLDFGSVSIDQEVGRPF